MEVSRRKFLQFLSHSPAASAALAASAVPLAQAMPVPVNFTPCVLDGESVRALFATNGAALASAVSRSFMTSIPGRFGQFDFGNGSDPDKDGNVVRPDPQTSSTREAQHDIQ